jgi:hypothetical protein
MEASSASPASPLIHQTRRRPLREPGGAQELHEFSEQN